MYKRQSQNGVAQGLYYNPLLPVYLFPPSENFERLKTYEIYDSGRNFATMYWPYSNTGLDALSQNPYWITNRNMFNTCLLYTSHRNAVEYVEHVVVAEERFGAAHYHAG